MSAGARESKVRKNFEIDVIKEVGKSLRKTLQISLVKELEMSEFRTHSTLSTSGSDFIYEKGESRQ